MYCFYPKIRAGKCPVFKPPAECPEEQENYCSHDRDCADVGQKCCNTGCILDCVGKFDSPIFVNRLLSSEVLDLKWLLNTIYKAE